MIGQEAALEAWSALRAINPAFRISTNIHLAKTHDEIHSSVEEAVDFVLSEHIKTRHLRQRRSEDELTIDIVTDLKMLGLQASHDTSYGGHCDIVIEAIRDFLWLAEAKIHKDYDWLLKGFQQLDTRYSTGMPGQDTGEMIIYCKGQRADLVLTRWLDHLREKRPDVHVVEQSALTARTQHAHKSTGNQFRVRHKMVPLFFAPDDKG